MVKTPFERVSKLRRERIALGLKRKEVYVHPADWWEVKALVVHKLHLRRHTATPYTFAGWEAACRQASYAARKHEPEALTECNDNDSPWLVCKTCFASHKCARDQPLYTQAQLDAAIAAERARCAALCDAITDDSFDGSEVSQECADAIRDPTPSATAPHVNDQRWDQNAERLTREAFGDDVDRPINMNAKTIDDL